MAFSLKRLLGHFFGQKTVINYSYTDTPFRLFNQDLRAVGRYSWALPLLLRPIAKYGSGELDELYPSWPNIKALLVHSLLFFLQVSFALAIPAALVLPVWMAFTGFVLVALLNLALSFAFLNRLNNTYTSDEKYAKHLPEHAHEQWIYLNGIMVGGHWMKCNLNRIALTFGRPVLGIHNLTNGFWFDIMECLIQRNFNYATRDVRTCFSILRKVLYDPKKTRVVFIAHSQGGIESSMVIDWLLLEMPQDLLSKLEVYTFGNAANHFNNPHRHDLSKGMPRFSLLQDMNSFLAKSLFAKAAERRARSDEGKRSKGGDDDGQGDGAEEGDDGQAITPTTEDRAIRHIEHFAHSTDMVALLGVLHFATNGSDSPMVPRFIGRVFNRTSPNGGHLLNQHYLDDMFPLKKDPGTGKFVGADEDNEFMEELVMEDEEGVAVSLKKAKAKGSSVEIHGLNPRPAQQVKVKDLCRLWGYRNGKTPSDESLNDEKAGQESIVKLTRFRHRKTSEKDRSDE